MAAAVAQGARFSFAGGKGSLSGGLTKISVDTPQAEITDATGLYDSTTSLVLVPTGAVKGGSINVEFIVSGTVDLEGLVGGRGMLTFTSSGYSVSKNVICETASALASVGDVVRGTAKFVPTDWYG